MSGKSHNFVGKKIDEYVLMSVLGTGAFGQVFEAQNISSKETVAIKSVPKAKLKEHNGLVGELLKTEVSVLMQCSNKNVVKMMKYLESENNCYLVMEYCNQGDFEMLWKKRNRVVPEKEAVQFLKQILNGMKGLHELNVIHRDIKLPNILISNGVLKIGDLGFAKRLNSKEQQVQSALGTLGTMAPEVIEFKPYGMLADMFSLGAIYYQMLFGVLPFSIKSYDDFLKDVKTNKPNLDKNGIHLSQESRDLLTKMLVYDPKARMKWNEIYSHPLFREQGGFEDLNQKVTISSIAAKQVNMKQNDDLYKKQHQEMDKVTGDNMYQFIKRGNQQGKPQQIHDDQQDDKGYQDALRDKELMRKKEHDINNTLERYLAERNMLVFLAKALDQIHKIHHSEKTNVFLPAFMITKKLMNENANLVNAIKNNQNIFKCQYLTDLYKNEMFMNFFRMLQDEQLVIADHFHIILAQCQYASEIFSKMQDPNPKIKSELSMYCSPYFEENYKDTLINYYFQIQEEKEMINDDVKRNQLINMLIITLDAITYQQLKNNHIQIDDYMDKFDFMTEHEKEKILEKKFLEIF